MNAPLRHPVIGAPARIAPLARLPLFFALGGKRAVVAGGSAAAAWKAELLSAAGSRVEVYAALPGEELIELARETGSIVIHRRAWQADDLRGAALAIGAFEDDAVAAEFAQSARALGVPVNVIDKPAFCDFSFGAIVNRTPLVIGISTDGAAPAFAQAIRARLEALLPQGFARWASAAAQWRGNVKASGLPFEKRRSFWRLFASRAMAQANAAPSDTDFQQLMAEAKRTDGGTGVVTAIDAPDDSDLLTLRTVRALQSADVVVFDPGVSAAVLDFARREARKISVGHRTRDEVDAMVAELARAGRNVVRLRSARAGTTLSPLWMALSH